MSSTRVQKIHFSAYVTVIAVCLLLQMLVLHAMGLPFSCACGRIDLWHANPAGPETSQHLTDWYTYTHVIHGFAFYLLLSIIAPGTSPVLRFTLAVMLETGWEILENTPLVMERYRQSALARGYSGDSILNSVADSFAAMLGFFLAHSLPTKVSIALIVLTEILLLITIRDSLTLNILQLISPSEAISNWQTR